MPTSPSTLARRARVLFASSGVGTLSTTSTELGGWPYGSWISYSLDELGRPIVALPERSEHRKNLEADDRATLLVVDPTPGPSPTQATIVARFVQVPASEGSAVALRHTAAVPEARKSLALSGAVLYRGEVRCVRLVDILGEAVWIEPDLWDVSG